MDSLIGRKIQDNDTRFPTRTGTIVGVSPDGGRVDVRWDRTGRITHVSRRSPKGRLMIGKTGRSGYRFIEEEAR